MVLKSSPPQLIKKGPLNMPPETKHRKGREEADEHAPMSMCTHSQSSPAQGRAAAPDAYCQLQRGSSDSILQMEMLRPGDLSK